MAYTGEDVRREAEAYLAEMRKCDEARKAMMQDFLDRIRAQNEKKESA